MEASKSIFRMAHQNLLTAFAFGVEAALTYTAMPILIQRLPPTIYTTIVFVLGGGVGFIATHLTRTLLRSQQVNLLNSIKEEKVRGAIHLAILTGIGLLAILLGL